MAITKKQAPKSVVAYNVEFSKGETPLQRELYCIRMGGSWKWPDGRSAGAGLFEHYMVARKLIWPDRYRHRWTDLAYRTVLENQITVMMGCASSQKSGSMAEIGLISYWADPENTLVLVSSTTREKLDHAIWGEIKMLWREAKALHKWLAGNPIEYKQCITTDELDGDNFVRDFRRGIVCKACFTGKSYVGLGAFAGIKQKNIWHCADELQFMAPTFFDSMPNMRSNVGVNGKGGLKVICACNPDHNPESQAGIVAEPEGGWAEAEGNEKTTVWPIRLSGGKCINFIGTDSPNFDHDRDIYPGLIGRKHEETIRKDYGLDSPQYESQVKGRMKMTLSASRVITRKICRDNGAMEKAVWAGTSRIKVHYTDPSYGGGDRCITGWAEFGEAMDGKTILRVAEKRLIRINLKSPLSPEDQIAAEVKRDLDDHGISPEFAGYDSFGKGTIGFAMAKAFGAKCPVPVDAGSRTTKRPVRYDLFVEESGGKKRLKRCDEHYSKFITEMWFAVREMIEAGQMRELPEDVMAEGCSRRYEEVSGNLIEVEPKAEMRLNSGKSPDLFDWLAGIVEMARRHGFKIQRLGDQRVAADVYQDWLEEEEEKYRLMMKSKMLQRAA